MNYLGFFILLILVIHYCFLPEYAKAVSLPRSSKGVHLPNAVCMHGITQDCVKPCRIRHITASIQSP